MKEAASAIAVFMTFAAYVPYVRDSFVGRTKPHLYTWLIWCLVTFLSFVLQVSDNAGPGALVTLAGAIAALVVLALSFRGRADISITRLDTACLTLAFAAIAAWLLADSPTSATALVTLSAFLGFVPTLRKSWSRPDQETLTLYVVNTFRFCLTLYAIDHYSVVSATYPVTWLLINGMFSLFLIARRRQASN